MIRACPELGFAYDTYFTDEIVIEKKNSLSELASNFASASDDGERIFKEFKPDDQRRTGLSGNRERQYRREFSNTSIDQNLIQIPSSGR